MLFANQLIKRLGFIRLGKKSQKLAVYETWSRDVVVFSREFFSESELSRSYNAKVQNARTQLIGYEFNLLNKV